MYDYLEGAAHCADVGVDGGPSSSYILSSSDRLSVAVLTAGASETELDLRPSGNQQNQGDYDWCMQSLLKQAIPGTFSDINEKAEIKRAFRIVNFIQF